MLRPIVVPECAQCPWWPVCESQLDPDDISLRVTKAPLDVREITTLRDLGIETRFVYTDAKTHFAHLRDGGDFDVARMSWIADYSDPQNFLFLLETDNVGFNCGRYASSAFDGLMRQAAAKRDLRIRARILFEAERIVLADLPWIPLMHTRSKALISPRLSGYRQNLRNVSPTRYLTLAS